MKTTDIFEMDDNSLKGKVTELERELGLTRAGLSAHGGKGQNYKKLGVLKRTIARISTVLRQRELGIQVKKEAKKQAKTAEKAESAKEEKVEKKVESAKEEKVEKKVESVKEEKVEKKADVAQEAKKEAENKSVKKSEKGE